MRTKMTVPSLRQKKVRLRSLMRNAQSVEACPQGCVPDVEMSFVYAVAGEENTAQMPYETSCRRNLSRCCRRSRKAERLRCVWLRPPNRLLRMTALEIL